MPQGGIVTTYSDITERVAASEALARANETLERRVRERTAELTEVNQALAIAKRKADEANLDKTRFLTAASHDVLQPLNAARLYVTSLVERELASGEAQLVRNIDASLEAVEEILNILIEISRLDTGRLEPDITSFPLDEVFERLKVEFAPLAREKAELELRVVATRLWVRTDRRLLRRVLQNLLANAIKYTPKGKVLLGVRRHGDANLPWRSATRGRAFQKASAPSSSRNSSAWRKRPLRCGGSDSACRSWSGSVRCWITR